MKGPNTQQLSLSDRRLVEEFQRGNRRVLARIISRIDDGEDAEPWLAAVKSCRNSEPKVIGITGPPGAGKSSLAGALISEIRRRNLTVAVMAVDPTSPYSGGAILGDRLRMNHHLAQDTGIYIRSLSTRDSTGGLSCSTKSVCRLLGEFGFDLILLETVGAGQADLSVMNAADLVLLTLIPGTGDTIQWEKAGQIEIADLFVLNKADLPAIDALESALRSALDQGTLSSKFGRHSIWGGMPPILRTVATERKGVEELLDTILDGFERLRNGNLSLRGPLRRRLRMGLEEEFERRLQKLYLNQDCIHNLENLIQDETEDFSEVINKAWHILASSCSVKEEKTNGLA